jgi:signal transduction histidine kinase
MPMSERGDNIDHRTTGEAGADKTGAEAAVSCAPAEGGGEDRVGELMQIIEAYNQVTERLQRSHETLTEEVKRLQRQLASANAALQRSRRLAALGEMAAGIAHEVRNPLASIQLYARMLEEDLADRPEQRELAERILSAVRGLDGTVHDVLSFARETEAQPEQGAVRPLLEGAVEAERPSLEAAGIELRYALEREGLELRHDPRLMHRALVNLIRNATQAMPDGGTLTLEASRDETAVHLVVRDTGPGIGDEAVDRIFNPFFTTRDTGTGLGLAIVHRILDAHGGSIAVHNDPSAGGAVFTL